MKAAAREPFWRGGEPPLTSNRRPWAQRIQRQFTTNVRWTLCLLHARGAEDLHGVVRTCAALCFQRNLPGGDQLLQTSAFIEIGRIARAFAADAVQASAAARFSA